MILKVCSNKTKELKRNSLNLKPDPLIHIWNIACLQVKHAVTHPLKYLQIYFVYYFDIKYNFNSHALVM